MVLFGLMLTEPVAAQQLILQGRILYERKENMHRQFDDEGGVWIQEMKKRMPRYRTDQFTLTFNRHKSAYVLTAEEENAVAANQFWRVAWNNAVLMDLQQQKMISEKAVYDEHFHVEDSIPVYKWKLTGEYREVAGKLCRKATTIIMDSLYVIAFYTDEIPVSSGPESITGLPGMILGMVVPRLHMTYFATRIDTQPVDEKDFIMKPLRKATQTNRKGMFTYINEAVKTWGKYGSRIYWRVVI